MSALGRAGEEPGDAHMCPPLLQEEVVSKNGARGTDTNCPGSEKELDKVHPDHPLPEGQF